MQSNAKQAMKFTSLILFVLIFSHCKSQEKTDAYSGFDPGLTTVKWKIEVRDGKAVTITTDPAKPKTFQRTLFRTQLPNFYFLDVSNIIPEREEKGFAIVEVGDRLLTLYNENVFSSKEELEKVLDKKDTLEYFPAIYLLKNISLSEAQKLPPVTSITDEKLAELRKLDGARKEKVRKIPENLKFERRLKLFAKQQFWLNAQLLLLGYKRENAEQNKFITEKLQ